MFDLTEIELCVDGQSMPSRSRKMLHVTSGRQIITLYSRLHDCTGCNCSWTFGNKIKAFNFERRLTYYNNSQCINSKCPYYLILGLTFSVQNLLLIFSSLNSSW